MLKLFNIQGTIVDSNWYKNYSLRMKIKVTSVTKINLSKH